MNSTKRKGAWVNTMPTIPEVNNENSIQPLKPTVVVSDTGIIYNEIVKIPGIGLTNSIMNSIKSRPAEEFRYYAYVNPVSSDTLEKNGKYGVINIGRLVMTEKNPLTNETVYIFKKFVRGKRLDRNMDYVSSIPESDLDKIAYTDSRGKLTNGSHSIPRPLPGKPYQGILPILNSRFHPPKSSGGTRRRNKNRRSKRTIRKRS